MAAKGFPTWWIRDYLPPTHGYIYPLRDEGVREVKKN